MKMLLRPLVLLLVTFGFGGLANGQVIHQSYTPVYPGPVAGSPIVSSPIVGSPVVISPSVTVDPFSACDCGSPHGSGDCPVCKNLNCELKVAPNCKIVRPLYKESIPCDIVGKIPKYKYEVRCDRKIADFQYDVDVPQIHCTTEYCVEIGKKQLTCIPGCNFSVCVPINKCKTETIECKLVKKKMNLELWERNKDGESVFDVYVINDPDKNSAFYAGGMPLKWLIIHCGTLDHIKRRFPNSVKADGTPLVKSKSKDEKPQKTDADVDIELVVQKDIVDKYLQQKQAEADAKDNDDEQKEKVAKQSAPLTQTAAKQGKAPLKQPATPQPASQPAKKITAATVEHVTVAPPVKS